MRMWFAVSMRTPSAPYVWTRPAILSYQKPVTLASSVSTASLPDVVVECIDEDQAAKSARSNIIFTVYISASRSIVATVVRASSMVVADSLVSCQ